MVFFLFWTLVLLIIFAVGEVVWLLAFICLFVGLSARLHKKLQVDLADIFRKVGLGPTWDDKVLVVTQIGIWI